MQFDYPFKGSEIKDLHTRQVLLAVRDNAPVSRSELCALTGISKSTSTRLVDDLLRDGFLEESGAMDSPGSRRKPIGLRLNPNRFYCIGVNITQSAIRTILTDFSATPLAESREEISSPMTAQSLAEQIEREVLAILAQNGKAPQQVLGAGVGLPGQVDSRTGMLINYASQGEITQFPLRDELEKRFSFPVLISNNVSSLILSEKTFSRETASDNCLFVSCWDGIGGAAVIGGTLLTGSTGAVGEVGHTIVEPFGKKCRCGGYGCAEAYCLPETLCEDVTFSVLRGRHSILSGKVTPETVMAAFEAGDSLCIEHVTRLAEKLSICLANAVNILNPDTVILAGKLFDLSEPFFQLTQALIREKLLNCSERTIVFHRRLSDHLLFRLGAVSLVFDAFFQQR